MLFALAITLATTFTGPVQNKQQPAKTQVIYVKESKEPCTGVAPMECLQIKGVNDTDWSNLYTNINGFKYTPGYRYKLRVRITQIKNPPADGSSLKYTLSKVLEKKKIPNTGSSADTGKKWVLIKMGDEAITDGAIWMELDPAQKRIHGKSGCNSMMGAYTISGNNITFSKTAGTLMACPDRDMMRRETTFMKQLGDQTFQYTVSGQTVSLRQNGNTILQFRLEENNSNEQQGTASNDKQWAFIGSKKWSVIKLNDTTLSNSGIWLEFDTNQKRFHGKGGCNSISGGYSATGNEIKFTKGISTRMACIDADVMRRETQFLKLISDNSFRYDVAEQTLNLYKDGKIVVMFGMQDKTL
ncbi:META domain-containing protein, partial [Chitinophaga sp.]|uniref:META domain-containing protein n=1 Tax=Chitinophaga sp. TaxID=1869181 RepID=UPI002BED3D88